MKKLRIKKVEECEDGVVIPILKKRVVKKNKKEVKCVICGKDFQTVSGSESSTCSVECLKSLRKGLSQRNTNSKYPGWHDGTFERNVCRFCQTKFEPREKETPGEYYGRLYCSHLCASRANARIKGAKRQEVECEPPSQELIKRMKTFLELMLE